MLAEVQHPLLVPQDKLMAVQEHPHLVGHGKQPQLIEAAALAQTDLPFILVVLVSLFLDTLALKALLVVR
jgi:hypothetical protein